MKVTNKTFRKSALPIVGMLMAAVLSLTSVTYAWFTSSSSATVDQIEIGVEAAKGLQIAVDGLDGTKPFVWGSKYTAIDALQGRIFSPMSSNGTVVNGELQLYSAEYDKDLNKIKNFAKVPFSSTNYLTFDLYIQNTDNYAKDLNITGTDVTDLLGANSSYAARIAFINNGTVSSRTSNLGLSSFNLVAKSNDPAVIYEPNANDHVNTGIEDYEQHKGSMPDGALDYLAIAGTSTTGDLYDRYTGVSYKEAAARTEDTTNGGVTAATGQYYVSSAATSGDPFTEWAKSADYTAITSATALIELSKVSGGRIVYNKSGDNYTKVARIEDINDETTYYLCNPVKTYTQTAQSDTTMKTVTTQGNGADEVYVTLAAETVTRLTVVIWLEGQDCDCTNEAAGGSFGVALKLNIIEEPEASE